MVDSIDWEDPDPYTIYDRTTTKTKSGSILLFHNDLNNTTQALPDVLTELLQQGFEFVRVEDMIYYEDYYIDNTGKQIYEPVSTTITPIVLYAEDPYANVAFEKMRLNLTLEEIYNLSVYGQIKIDVIKKNQTFLSDAEIAALYHMSYEELYAAYIALVYAAETYGAKDYTPPSLTTTTALETTPEETTAVTTAPVTTLGDKTDIIYDKTDVAVTTIGDKTDVAVTTIGDKTDITIAYPDKTEIVTGTMGDKTETAITTYGDKTEAVTTTASPETTTVSDTTTTRPIASDNWGVQGEQENITTTEPK